jgi:hypothetical protein
MAEILKDGVGKGFYAKVDSTNRLHVDASQLPRSSVAAFDGNAYNINTGTINLTGTTNSGLLYVKNTGEKTIVIASFIYLLGNTDGSGDTLVQVIRNPTAGTLISGGSEITPVNRNFNTSKTAAATVLKGSHGSTVTDGTVVIESIFSGVGRQVVNVGAVILNKNNTIAIKVQAPTGTTDMDVQLAISCYEESEFTNGTS